MIDGSVLEMPFADDSFDLAVSLDVIEHLEDDLGALRELRRTVAPGGALLVTVPAYQWLWSGHDEINHHHRRYTRRSLQRVAEQAGWQSGAHDLLQLAAAARRDRAARARPRQPGKTTESSLDLWVPPEPLNWLLERPLALEAALIARGGRIPAGLSLLSCVPLASDGCARKVQARLTKNVVTVTIAVAHTCAMSLSRPASWTNRYSRPRLTPSPQVCTIPQRTA